MTFEQAVEHEAQEFGRRAALRAAAQGLDEIGQRAAAAHAEADARATSKIDPIRCDLSILLGRADDRDPPPPVIVQSREPDPSLLEPFMEILGLEILRTMQTRSAPGAG